MSDLERVREALPKDKPVACPNEDGCLADWDWAHSRCKSCPPHPSIVHPARLELDAHLKEDAEREEWRLSQIRDLKAELTELRASKERIHRRAQKAEAELAELREQLREAGPAQQALYRSIEQRDKLTRELAELREAVREFLDGKPMTRNRLRQLIEEDERGPAATDSAISKERRGEKP